MEQSILPFQLRYPPLLFLRLHCWLPLLPRTPVPSPLHFRHLPLHILDDPLHAYPLVQHVLVQPFELLVLEPQAGVLLPELLLALLAARFLSAWLLRGASRCLRVRGCALVALRGQVRGAKAQMAGAPVLLQVGGNLGFQLVDEGRGDATAGLRKVTHSLEKALEIGARGPLRTTRAAVGLELLKYLVPIEGLGARV